MHVSSLSRLSAFEGSPHDSFQLLYRTFADDYADAGIALLDVQSVEAGCYRLLGLIAPGGRVLREALWRPPQDSFRDALGAWLPQREDVFCVDDAPPASGPLRDPLHDAAWVCGCPIYVDGKVNRWLLLFGSGVVPDTTRLLLHGNLALRMLDGLEQTKRQQHISRDISSLARVQRLLLPVSPSIRGMTHAIHYEPAEVAAGDYYDMMALTHLMPDYDGRAGDAWGVMVADVSGHGLAAAMEAAMFDAVLRTYRGDAGDGPAGAITYANRHFFSRQLRPFFITAAACVYHPGQQTLDYVTAGHPPILHRHEGRVIELKNDGIPVGVSPEFRYENSQRAIASGDALLLFTDGVLEAEDDQRQPFGLERVRELFRRHGPEPDTVITELREALREHQGSIRGQDDQTIIAVHIPESS